jgi:GNAT superfamily N-acetyltransferase
VGDLVYRTLTEDLAEQCAALELAAFPHADPDDLLSAQDIVAYAEVFPEGFFVCMDGDRVVGQAAGIFLDFDFDHPQHSIAEITGEHQCANHDPEGDWYYGTDIVVHPDYRKRGIGRRLYELRKELVERYGRRGIVAGGYMHDFVDHKHRMSAAEYLDAVAAGEIYDSTLTFQMENGFVIRGLLSGYLRDEGTDDHAALIVWEKSRR